jgi:hypothetical protein
MAKPSKKVEEKRSVLKTLFSWVFDLTIVGLLIWYLSNADNRATVVSTASNWFKTGVAIVYKPPSASLPTATPQATSTPPLPFFMPPPVPTATQLAKEVPGDCFPPETRGPEDAVAIAKLFYQPPPLPKTIKMRKGHGKPVEFDKRKVKGFAFYQVTVDLTDPDSYVVIRLPHNASQANSTTFTAGHELFDSFVKRSQAAIVINGTFFSKDDQERVMGNMVSEGKSLKYSQWENYGTTLSLREGDYPEMVTARAQGAPKWKEQWFSLTCGPRLLKEGEIWLNPELEGFTDPHVLGVGPRSAIGFPKSRDRLYLIVFLQGLSLEQEAKAMKAIGCYEAMNLDGGASKALCHDEAVIMKPGRGLTNVLVVYDSKHKAPNNVIASWQRFQEGNRQ